MGLDDDIAILAPGTTALKALDKLAAPIRDVVQGLLKNRNGWAQDCRDRAMDFDEPVFRRRLRAWLRAPLLDELSERLVDKYFVNFSVFESMPDVWAIDQVFPITPIERLDEAPTRRGIIGRAP